MSSSKLISLEPILNLGHGYTRLLKSNPILIKSITSGLLSALGNYLAQVVGSNPSGESFKVNRRSIIAFGIFGFAVTGPAAHFWLNFLEKYGPSHPILKLILDRFGYGPALLLLTLYLLPVLEGSSHIEAEKQVRKVYLSALKTMWKVWIIVQYVNLNFVPLQYRVLVSNVVSIGWNIYLSKTRAKQQQKKSLKEE